MWIFQNFYYENRNSILLRISVIFAALISGLGIFNYSFVMIRIIKLIVFKQFPLSPNKSRLNFVHYKIVTILLLIQNNYIFSFVNLIEEKNNNFLQINFAIICT